MQEQTVEVVRNLSNADYRKHAGVSKTDLDRVHISPLHYQTYKDAPQEDTAALLFGRAYHKLIGEPDTFDREFAVSPHVDRRTKAGKEAWEEFLLDAGGKSVITEDDYNKLLEMRSAFDDHEIAPKLIHDAKFETSIFWVNTDFEVKCKCRPDAITADGYLVDFKTTESAKPDEFIKSAYKYRYHVQAYWYSHGYGIATGKRPKGFIFIAQEKKPPYAITVFKADAYFIELGRMDALNDLRAYAECLHSRNFYGYGYNENTLHYEIQQLSLPPYIIKQNFTERMGG